MTVLRIEKLLQVPVIISFQNNIRQDCTLGLGSRVTNMLPAAQAVVQYKLWYSTGYWLVKYINLHVSYVN